MKTDLSAMTWFCTFPLAHMRRAHRALRTWRSDRGIRVNSAAAGTSRTPLIPARMPPLEKAASAGTPGLRCGRPVEVAAALVFRTKTRKCPVAKRDGAFA
jgi:NAD(P)-dependent dehydrogenase (short-subunit alcohol dehydrogenase family)